MMEIIYRVIVKVAYHEAYFDFASADQACNFMRSAVESSNGGDDDTKVGFIMKIVRPTEESEEE